MRTAQNRAVRVSEIFVIVDHFLKEIEDFDEFGRPCRELRQPEGCHALYMACRDEILLSRRAILFYSRRQLNQKG